ncbi:outer membrane beta-barrel family protein [Flavobacterium sp. GT3R68]|uniref:outer membrane beta-barrel family protein n=1 Tax=Flavobacterium sp. GT3R68 TaxID=2594437 RepID=UPI000F875714|nr:outer membrane beta-barrel family protein [Flavobacterium sp. GT3R68]RTY94908.1 TonB-dependent receptor [Flavobacterium sp. GSN2]TRW91712.1 TonB-dependent receptor [Flavobacterium sp. GT3R68]
MKSLKSAITLVLLCTAFLSFSQGRPTAKKIKITGKVVENVSKQPLEYATITFLNPKNPKAVAGGITNAKGEFDIEINAGTYDIVIEFISFKVSQMKGKKLAEDTNLGQIGLEEDLTQLNEVVVRAEKTTVEIKLDKKVYNVGTDLLVKGGTVSDVLDNIPSVAVDADGTVSLRGNENVRILIDGKPSNAINIAEALRQIPADAIEKVELVTNPSARYDSEGGGGLLNIILKKGKNQGINGTIIASAGNPESYGLSTNLNFKSEQFNLFTNIGYNYRTNPGNSLTNTEYLNEDGSIQGYTDERRHNERVSKGYNSSFGMDWFLDKTTTWTNSVSFRKNKGENPDTVNYFRYDENHQFESTDSRFNDQISKSTNFEYASNLTKKFKKDGHKLTVDASFAQNRDNDSSVITSDIFEQTSNAQKQNRNMIQTDYVFPFGKASQFEMGYKGDFNKLVTNYKVGEIENGLYAPNNQFTNILEYKEQVNALYTQYGTKIDKFSFLFGLRWEDSKIDINQLATNDYNTKKYNSFFPSAFFTYEISNQSSASLSYSRRISRPRGRQINPFSNYSSNINIFQGNPNLNPAFTDAIDIGYLKRWSKLTFNTSLYVNKTTDSFQMIRRENGDFVITVVDEADTIDPNTGSPIINGGEDIKTPVILSTPINLATEYRLGFEFTLNYSPFKWWKLNSNFNFFRNETQGDYTYTNSQNVIVSQNFDNTAYSWFTRITSKVTLPYKIDWQTNATYNGAQKNAQGRSLGNLSANLGLSKDVLKDKGTIALNVQDVFNSRKRIFETSIPGVLNSYSEMQWRVRQINLSFTYRFNKQKGEKEKQPKRENDNGEEFQG